MLLLSDFYAFYGCGACAVGGCSYCINSGDLFVDLLAGGRPAATHFLLLRQKKVSKEKATRLSGSLRFASGNLRCPAKTGVGANSLHCVALKQRAALIPFLRSITGPDRTGHSGNESQAADQPGSLMVKTSAVHTINLIAGDECLVCVKGTFDAQTPVSESESACPVLAGPVLVKESRIRAARCLSAASLRGPRLSLTSAGCPKRSAGIQTAGRLFFGDFLLARQKKVTSRRATPGQQPQAKSTHPKNTTDLMAGTKP